MIDISREDIDQLNAVLKIHVKEDDYLPKIESSVKEYSKKADLKGFRKGKVPPNVIKNMYGDQILAEELNKIVGEGLNNYLKENNVEILGQPLPKTDEELRVNASESKDYEFSFELGLSPEITLGTISSKTKFNKYKLLIDAKMLDEEIDNLRMKNGNMTNPDNIEEKDVLYLNFSEIDDTKPSSRDEEETEVLQNDVSLPLDMFTNKNLVKEILKAEKSDTFEIDIFNTFDKSEEEIRKNMLGLESDDDRVVGAKFLMTIKNINRMMPCDIDQEFFNKVYGEGNVKSIEEFKGRLEKELSGYLDVQAGKKLEADIVEHMIKVTKFGLPDEFLKKWIIASNEKPISPKQLDDEYDNFAKNLKWSLIINSLAKDQDIKVKPEDVETRTRESIIEQMRMYGSQEIEAEHIEMYVKQMLQNEEHVKKIYEQLASEQVFDYLKSTYTIKEKKTSIDEFNKLLQK